MFFLNLTFGEFAALLGALSGIITALYLLDRAKRKRVVSTLRFWVDAPRVDEQRRRKRVRDPWSLVLQLLSLLLLLLAIGQLQWGSREQAGRDHVLLLDTSSWMAQRHGDSNLLEEAKQKARAYVSSLPPRDRVMVMRTDGLTSPVTSFTNDHKQPLKAIAASQPSFTALNLRQALESATRALHWSGSGRGEVVYIGAGRVADSNDAPAPTPGLRVLQVDASPENVGVRQIGVRRSEAAVNLWEASIALRNYGTQARNVVLHVRFADTEFAPRPISLEPGENSSAEYRFSTTGAGTLAARITPGDSLSLDDHAEVELPPAGLLQVAVFSSRPDVWRPLLDSNPRLHAIYGRPDQYTPHPNADVLLFDGMAPPSPPELPSLWVMPPAKNSPIPIASTQTGARLEQWHTETALGAGLHSKELRLPIAEIFERESGGIPVASSDAGPVVMAQGGSAERARLAVIGFDPLNGPLRFEVSTPLLFANLLRWLEPESFRAFRLTAGAVGIASIPLDAKESAQNLKIVDDRGFTAPFTIRNGVLQLYTARPSVVRVLSNDRERVLSLTLPGMAEFAWQPPPATPRELPRAYWFAPSAFDLWKWLAALGAIGLLVEWLFFGQQRPLQLWHRAARSESSRSSREELVNK
jgi:hypothetical protein